MIHIEDLNKYFGDLHAVADVSLDVMKGEVVGLLGPNGAGKTTTMRIITGYLRPDGGTVTIDGFPVGDEDLKTKSLIGYLPENAPLYHDMEVTEFLSYIASLRSLDKCHTASRIEEMVHTCKLAEVVGRQIGKLSKGYRQRVGLAASMIHKPPILILDEPTSGLDPNQIVEIRNLIRDIGKERTVVLSTHIMQEVEATCSKAFIISSGRLVGHGTIDELIKTGAAHMDYTVSIKGARDDVCTKLASLSDFEVMTWLGENSGRQRLVLKCHDSEDRSEDIFKWAVDSNLTLTELSHNSASLEEVFRELTGSR